jgi:ABC-type Co2+ transport system permease subunit
VSSSLHIPVGPTRAHLLLTGLVGVILGPRACLAIPLALLLQYFLLQHGGFWTLGVNSCVMAVPALLSWLLFALLHRLPWLRHPWFRSLLVAVCSLTWLLSLAFSVTLLCTNPLRTMQTLDLQPALALTLHPLTLLTVLLLTGLVVRVERRLENAPEFPLGLLIGELAVLATVALNCLVLLYGGERDWLTSVLILIVLELPLAVVEGAIVGFTVGFLARVKPEMLGMPAVRHAVFAAQPQIETSEHIRAAEPLFTNSVVETPRPAAPPTVPVRD